MTYRAILFLTTAILVVPVSGYAAPSNFSRDRSVAVAQRVPQGYEALGIHAGAFIVSPQLDLDVSHKDNVFYTPTNEQSDTVLSISPSVTLRSDWGRHALSAALSADYDNFTKFNDENVLRWTASGAGRIDVKGNSNIFGSAAFSQNYEPRYDPSSPRFDPSNPNSPAEPVKFDTTLANAGFVIEGNRLRFTGVVNLMKWDYDDVAALNTVAFPNGIDQDFRDYTKTGFSGRADYALSPRASVYVVYEANKRDYRLAVSGRDSEGYDTAIGASFDLTNLIRGEVQVGKVHQTYKNPAFRDSDGGSFRARIEYFPTQLITLTLIGSRTVEETPYLAAAGYTSTALTTTADYELLRNLVLTGTYAYITDDYNGADREDKRSNFRVGARYLMSRKVAFEAGYSHSENDSTGTQRIPSYKDNTFRIGAVLKY